MALFTESQLRNRVDNVLIKDYSNTYGSPRAFKARMILNESKEEQRQFSKTAKTYDIFLSHSSSDAELVAGLKLLLEDLGYSVYIDWLEDPQLDRSKVNKETAALLRERMKSCSVLLYAFSENAIESKWMPWELGYFDGIKGKIAILPIVKTRKSDFKGAEYLGLYYYIMIDEIKGTEKTTLWVHENANKYVIYSAWIGGREPFLRT